MTEEEKKQKKAAKELARKQNKGKLGAEFKAFITRGNVIDMAVGVIMGNAFGAIVTALTNILLSIVTWGVPGGLKGLVTVLPAINDMQAGMNPAIGLGQKFAATDLQAMGKALAEVNYAEQIAANSNYLSENPNLIEAAKSTILSKYTIHGSVYTYNLSATIDWGTFINAVIAFLIIALTLFTIVKIFNRAKAYRVNIEAQIKAKKDAEWAKNHPEAAALKAQKEAEAKAAAEAGVEVKPDNIVLLEEIRDEIKSLNTKNA